MNTNTEKKSVNGLKEFCSKPDKLKKQITASFFTGSQDATISQ